MPGSLSFLASLAHHSTSSTFANHSFHLQVSFWSLSRHRISFTYFYFPLSQTLKSKHEYNVNVAMFYYRPKDSHMNYIANILQNLIKIQDSWIQMLTWPELQVFAALQVNKIPEYFIKTLQLHPPPNTPLGSVSLRKESIRQQNYFWFCSQMKSLIPVAFFLLLNAVLMISYFLPGSE